VQPATVVTQVLTEVNEKPVLHDWQTVAVTVAATAVAANKPEAQLAAPA
jgi:hypothetical protein